MEQADVITTIVKARAILASMAGITDSPFRMIARKFGCAFAFTEMIDVNGIVYNNRKTYRLMERVSSDMPLGIQLVGSDEDKILYAAQVAEEKGFELLDFNAACPARKVTKAGKGAALLKEPVKLASIIQRLVRVLKIPVTVKIRSGWDEKNLNYMEVVKAVVSEGVRAISVHPRTKEEMYKKKANREIIREIKEKFKVPVFASGDIFTIGDIENVFAATRCDAVLAARGALGRPWFFREINNFLLGGRSEKPLLFKDIKNVITEHFELCFDFYGEKMTFKRMYKHLVWYLKKFGNLDEVLKRYRQVENLRAFRGFMRKLYVDKKNNLTLRF